MANASNIPVLIPQEILFPTGLSQFFEMVNQINQQTIKLAETFYQIDKAVNSMSEQFLQVQKAIESFPFARMAEIVEAANRRIFQQMRTNTLFPYSHVIDAKFEEKEVATLAVNTTFAPRPIAIPLPATIQPRVRYHEIFEDFHVAVTIEGRFYYEDHLLEYISTNSKQGQFLLLLLEAQDNYITDANALAKLKPSDPEKGLGYIRDDLAKYLYKEGLEINLYRQRKTGYKLLKITRLSN